MSQLETVEPGDRSPFVEHWVDLNTIPHPSDLRFLVVQSLCRLLDLSRQAVDELGVSYRGHKVGAAVMAYDENGGRVGFYYGGNYTPYQGAGWNCAEKRAFEVVGQRGFSKVLAIATSGPAYTNSVSGIESPTCQPCHRCMGMFASSDLVSPDTLIASTNLTEDEFEIHTVASQARLHETGQPQPFPSNYHPRLEAYWNQVLSYDAETERAELETLERIRHMQVIC